MAVSAPNLYVLAYFLPVLFSTGTKLRAFLTIVSLLLVIPLLTAAGGF
ncbi:MAG TPA: hypothetical protein VFM49_27160 [Chloroflexia bacterium]|nr:hypothetical protein [Chloroflexia bacterium]